MVSFIQYVSSYFYLYAIYAAIFLVALIAIILIFKLFMLFSAGPMTSLTSALIVLLIAVFVASGFKVNPYPINTSGEYTWKTQYQVDFTVTDENNVSKTYTYNNFQRNVALLGVDAPFTDRTSDAVVIACFDTLGRDVSFIKITGEMIVKDNGEYKAIKDLYNYNQILGSYDENKIKPFLTTLSKNLLDIEINDFVFFHDDFYEEFTGAVNGLSVELHADYTSINSNWTNGSKVKLSSNGLTNISNLECNVSDFLELFFHSYDGDVSLERRQNEIIESVIAVKNDLKYEGYYSAYNQLSENNTFNTSLASLENLGEFAELFNLLYNTKTFNYDGFLDPIGTHAVSTLNKIDVSYCVDKAKSDAGDYTDLRNYVLEMFYNVNN